MLHRRYPASSLVWASPTPAQAAAPVMSFRRASLAFRSPPGRVSQAPRLICPRALSPTTPEGPLAAYACCFTSGVWLHPSRQTGHLRIPIEAESGSLTLRLTGSPPQSPIPLLESALVRLHAEQAIYMVNSFQFTRSARLILAYRPSGSACNSYFLTVS